MEVRAVLFPLRSSKFSYSFLIAVSVFMICVYVYCCLVLIFQKTFAIIFRTIVCSVNMPQCGSLPLKRSMYSQLCEREIVSERENETV